MKSGATAPKEPAKSAWFLRPEQWPALSIPTTESGASVCRWTIHQPPRHRFRNHAGKPQPSPKFFRDGMRRPTLRRDAIMLPMENALEVQRRTGHEEE